MIVARRSRNEVALFGRSGEELNPALQKWAEGAGYLADQLRTQNRLLGEDTVDAAEKARISMSKAWDSLVTESAPAITGTVNLLAEMIGAFGKIDAAAANYPKVTDYNKAAYDHSGLGTPLAANFGGDVVMTPEVAGFGGGSGPALAAGNWTGPKRRQTRTGTAHR